LSAYAFRKVLAPALRSVSPHSCDSKAKPSELSRFTLKQALVETAYLVTDEELIEPLLPALDEAAKQWMSPIVKDTVMAARALVHVAFCNMRCDRYQQAFDFFEAGTSVLLQKAPLFSRLNQYLHNQARLSMLGWA
jgi:hypothetical protein